MLIQDSVALVTGANRGLGRALVDALLSAGAAKVYAGTRDPARFALSGDLRARVVPVQLDVTAPHQIAEAARVARDVSLVINNAGVWESGSLLDTPIEKVDRDLTVNFFGTLAVSRAFAPVLASRGGAALVNVLSVVSLATLPALGGYSASKAAAWAMTQGLRAELAPRGVTVFAAFPGTMDTDMVRHLSGPKTSPERVATAILEGVRHDVLDLYPDPISEQVGATWSRDPRALVQQFAMMAPG